MQTNTYNRALHDDGGLVVSTPVWQQIQKNATSYGRWRLDISVCDFESKKKASKKKNCLLSRHTLGSALLPDGGKNTFALVLALSLLCVCVCSLLLFCPHTRRPNRRSVWQFRLLMPTYKPHQQRHTLRAVSPPRSVHTRDTLLREEMEFMNIYAAGFYAAYAFDASTQPVPLYTTTRMHVCM